MVTHAEPDPGVYNQLPFLLDLLLGLAFAHTAPQEVQERTIDAHVDRHPDGVSAGQPTIIAERSEQHYSQSASVRCGMPRGLIEPHTHSLDSLDTRDGVEHGADGDPLGVFPAQLLRLGSGSSAVPHLCADHEDRRDGEGRPESQRLPRVHTGIEARDEVGRARVETAQIVSYRPSPSY